MSKPIVIIYLNPKSKSTEILEKFLASYIDQINEHLYIKRVKVNSKNLELVKKRGIQHTPTLVYNKRKFVSVEKIIKILTPPADQKDHYGYGNTSSDDLIHQYHTTLLDTGDDNNDDDDLDPKIREAVLKQKMAAMQKNRPQMDGVDKTRKLNGGRKIKNNQPIKSSFNSDTEFMSATNLNTVAETPTRKYMDEDDGALILEDYYLEEANRNGKKVGKNVSKKR